MSDSVKAKVGARVKITPRLEVLTIVLTEYAKSFGASQRCLKSIEKGVCERQIIKKIYLNYFNKEKFVGQVTMEIDWSAHKVLVNSDSGKEFKVRTDVSLLHQLDAASAEIIKHVNRMRKECGVTRIESSYSYTEEYSNNPEKDAEAKKFLGHMDAKDAYDKTKSTDMFKTYVGFISDKLEELKITVEC